eukprot:15477872-Alexandrium_andersonii.AAC.1
MAPRERDSTVDSDAAGRQRPAPDGREGAVARQRGEAERRRGGGPAATPPPAAGQERLRSKHPAAPCRQPAAGRWPRHEGRNR